MWGRGVHGRCEAHLPLCSPRKTSLNFLSGLPKSPPEDMVAAVALAVSGSRGRRGGRGRPGNRGRHWLLGEPLPSRDLSHTPYSQTPPSAAYNQPAPQRRNCQDLSPWQPTGAANQRPEQTTNERGEGGARRPGEEDMESVAGSSDSQSQTFHGPQSCLLLSAALGPPTSFHVSLPGNEKTSPHFMSW